MTALAAEHYESRQIEAFLQAVTPDLGPLIRAGTIWTAWSGDELVASAAWHAEGALPTLGRIASPDPGVAVFRTVFVTPDRARNGLGSMMMDRAEADARLHGARRGNLHAMLSAVEFYRRRGYRMLGEAAFDLEGIRFPGVSMTRGLVGPDAASS